MTAIDMLPFPICNFFIKEQGSNNICDDLSKMLILPSDAVFMSLLLGIPVYLSSESIDRFSIRIASGMSLRDAVCSCRDVLISSEKKS
jgi:bifunctional DNase/RNase